MIVMLLVSGKNMLTIPDAINPIARKYLGFDLSDTFPITNLLIP